MMIMVIMILLTSHRLVSGMPPTDNQDYETTCFWFTTTKRSTVLSSSRQAVREYVFDTRKRIGLEVEIVNDAVSNDDDDSDDDVHYQVVVMVPMT